MNYCYPGLTLFCARWCQRVQGPAVSRLQAAHEPAQRGLLPPEDQVEVVVEEHVDEAGDRLLGGVPSTEEAPLHDDTVSLVGVPE